MDTNVEVHLEIVRLMCDLVKNIAFPILFDDVVELSIARLETRTEEFNIAVSHCTKKCRWT